MCTICMMTQTFEPRRHEPGEPVFGDVIEGVDAAEDISTAYTMSVGDTFFGTIANSLDEDWVRIELTTGTTYEFAHNGISLSDPLVRLYDASGVQVAVNDDGGPGLDSLLEYTAIQGGTFFVSADAYSTNTGSYALSVTESIPPPPPGTTGTLEQLGTFLMEGTSGDRRVFDTSQSNQITVDISGLTADGQQLARWAMDAWEMVADIDFIVQNDGVQGNEMITVDDEDSGAFAYFPNSGSTSTAQGDNTNGVELNVADSWLDQNGTTLDSYSFQTYVHEFGHALGLRHQGNYNFTPGQSITYQRDAYFTNDSWQLSVMSYFSQTENTSTNASFAYLSGAMMADIWAIQELYGAPDATSATTGNTVYGQGSNLGNYMDEIFDWLASGTTTANVTGNTLAFTIYDRDGIDTIDLGFLQEAARLDMRAEQFSDFGTYTGILGIARGTVIENAIVGSGNDTVTGNGAANAVYTNGGNDSITSGNGNDSVYAGSGRDTVYAGEGADMVWGGNGRDLIFLNQGDDLFTDDDQGGVNGRDTVFAGLGNDSIQGGNGDDEFYGENGNDLINGGLGDDLIFGGNQFDTIYAGEGQDTVLGGNGRDLVFLNQGNDLFNDNGQGGVLGRDTVFGGFGDDTIEGGGGDDALHGEWGNDVINGREGRDLITGGDGADLIFGGDQFDTITAGAGNDTVFGGNGRDSVDLGAGNDRYIDTAQGGVNGQDTITGGAGSDTFVFGGTVGNDVITDFEVGVDRLELASALVGGRSVQQTVDQLFSAGDSFVSFSAGEDQTIALWNISTLDGLANSIDIT